MKKLNSLFYLSYYLLLWVVLPATGVGASVFAYDLNDRSQYSITKGEADFSDFLQGVNPDWTRLNSAETTKNLLFDTGHWPLVFSSDHRFRHSFGKEEDVNPNFSNSPFLGAFAAFKIIFPFHYFW
ncbi:hypothetical protein LZF95_04670 [Algoriphagus sp. AGSA1]|uniref:hypothetical protein n=1 Tax=Algoriphagus sp. AGSA1 TaxID=2907213 RepID=UPI001F22A0CE|nr:hypothetical protein [Algoriphagus sp. AGSA1]MCE7053961.1 hypothetical protein [Algoriphagus sp. AGSA1]